MKVVQHTSDQLTLQARPGLEWVVGAVFVMSGGYVALTSDEVLFGSAFLVAGLMIVLFLARTRTYDFDLRKGQCTLGAQGLLGTKETRHPLRQIVGARVVRSNSSKGVSYRVALVLASGEDLPLTSASSSGKQDKEKTAALIREFLNLPEPVEIPIPGFRDLLGLVLDPAAQQQAMSAGYGEAIAGYEAQIRHNPENVDAYRNLAATLALQNRPDEARAKLQHAQQLLRRTGNHAGALQLDAMLDQIGKAAEHRSI